MLKLFSICFSFWFALASTFLRLDIIISRLTLAIRQQDCKWNMNWEQLAFFWTLFLISCLI